MLLNRLTAFADAFTRKNLTPIFKKDIHTQKLYTMQQNLPTIKYSIKFRFVCRYCVEYWMSRSSMRTLHFDLHSIELMSIKFARNHAIYTHNTRHTTEHMVNEWAAFRCTMCTRFFERNDYCMVGIFAAHSPIRINSMCDMKISIPRKICATPFSTKKSHMR